jgi:hypothetical protein
MSERRPGADHEQAREAALPHVRLQVAFISERDAVSAAVDAMVHLWLHLTPESCPSTGHPQSPQLHETR